MAHETVKRPGVITLTPRNFFHEGWLWGLLGMPPRAFTSVDHPVRDVDINAWRDGYGTARQSSSLAIVAHAMQRSHDRGDIIIDIEER